MFSSFVRFLQLQNEAVKENALPIIAKLFWLNSSSGYMNNHCRKLLNSVARCAAACSPDNINFRYLQQILLQLNRILQTLCEYCKVKSLEDIGADVNTFVKEFASILKGEFLIYCSGYIIPHLTSSGRTEDAFVYPLTFVDFTYL